MLDNGSIVWIVNRAVIRCLYEIPKLPIMEFSRSWISIQAYYTHGCLIETLAGKQYRGSGLTSSATVIQMIVGVK